MIKIVKNTDEARLITHGGTFHADEVLATVILSKMLGDVTISRVLEVPENRNKDVIVYDIGCGELDHHQKGGNGRRENDVPYSSVGLIWKKYGMQIIEEKYGGSRRVWEMVDRDLIQGVDAVDNGTLPKPNYPVNNMDFSSIISSFNPLWDSDDDQDEAFLRAVSFADTVFENTVFASISMEKALKMVDDAIENATDGILVLDIFIPWREVFFDSHKNKTDELLYVVFPSDRGGYYLQCIPESPGSYELRKALPLEWRGLRGKDFQEVCGIKTAIFCHPSGFIAGADTFEDTMKLAHIAIGK